MASAVADPGPPWKRAPRSSVAGSVTPPRSQTPVSGPVTDVAVNPMLAEAFLPVIWLDAEKVDKRRGLAQKPARTVAMRAQPNEPTASTSLGRCNLVERLRYVAQQSRSFWRIAGGNKSPLAPTANQRSDAQQSTV